MVTRTVGPLPVSRVGFGAMQLPGPGVFGPPADPERAVEVLRMAVGLGVDHIDTAQYYGPDVANDLIREALYPYPDELVLVSKVGARRDDRGGWLPADSPEELRAGVEANLRSLRVDRLGAVNLRVMPGPVEGGAAERFLEQLDTMVALRDEGLIGGVGVSNVTLAQFETARERAGVVCVQNPLNVVDRASMDVLEACGRAGVTFVPFFPLGSGFGDRNPVLGSPVVQRVAARLEATAAQVALAWLLAQGPHVAVIPGTSSPQHLRENLAAADLVLDEEAQSELAGLTGVPGGRPAAGDG